MIRSLFETLESSHAFDLIGVRAERCAHSLSSKSHCDRCVRYCPTGAMTAPGIVESSRCVRCGSCVEHCPTEALGLQRSSTGALRRRLAAVLEHCRSVLFVCERAPARPRRREDAVVLPCISRLPLEQLIPRLLNRQAQKLLVGLPRACGTCPAQPAMREKLVELKRLRSLLRTSDPAGRRAGEIAVVSLSEQLPAPVRACTDRRFRAARRIRKDRAKHGVPRAAALGAPGAGSDPPFEALPTETQHTVDSSRRDLLAAVKGLPAHSTIARLLFGISLPQVPKLQPARNGALRDRLARRAERLRADEALRRAGFPVFFYPGSAQVTVGESCTLCNACASICPTAALQRGREGAVEYLRHDPQHCLHCGVCADLCSPGAITLTSGGRDLRARRLLQRAEQSCVGCGRLFLDEADQQYCRGCRRRQTVFDASKAPATGTA